MLVYDAAQRITIEGALQHPYMASLHFPDDEPTTEKVKGFDFDFEKFKIGTEDYKDIMYQEIMLYHSDDAALEYIQNKEQFPNGILHKTYGEKLRSAFR